MAFSETVGASEFTSVRYKYRGETPVAQKDQAVRAKGAEAICVQGSLYGESPYHQSISVLQSARYEGNP
jgi:hypothetical protein